MKLNVTMVFNMEENKILMCYRSKNPYMGLYNLVGGKIEENENFDEAAYRELEEETGITKNDIILTHVMDFNYFITGTELQFYAGKLNKDIEVIDEVNKLYWFDISENLFDLKKFAGEGNIGHMIEQVWLHKDDILK